MAGSSSCRAPVTEPDTVLRHVIWLQWTLPGSGNQQPSHKGPLSGRGLKVTFASLREVSPMASRRPSPRTSCSLRGQPGCMQPMGEAQAWGQGELQSDPAFPFRPPSFCSMRCFAPAYQNFPGPGSQGVPLDIDAKKASGWDTNKTKSKYYSVWFPTIIPVSGLFLNGRGRTSTHTCAHIHAHTHCGQG